jgi:serine/threonine protein kinase/Tol biopolymer transport system component
VLEIGQTILHYRILEMIGVGGMGEVYRAKDQKLGRDVAIKLLPKEFAKDADRVARFQREAKLLASLNHPSIAAIHGLEESEGTHFLVLELIEGDTLADRLKHGAIPIEESLKLALQIAEALEAAHEKGVIHRDLKPANIKVTPDGKVKVLDFGLAKALAGEQENLNVSDSPTLSMTATQEGIILGTAGYMSPEQARGKPVDKRADIWAFGVVLCEMLTGRSLFAGDDVSQTLARVLERQPDYSALPPNLHPRIHLLLERCLEKEARDRCSGIGDARVEIQKALADPSGVSVQQLIAAESKGKLRLGLSWITAIVVLTGIIAGVAVWILKPSEPRQVIRSEYCLPEDQQLSNVTYPNLAVSPDGKQIVYGTSKGLYLHSVDELTARLISGTEGDVRRPFFSPDGKWIGYFSATDQKLKKIEVNGGESIPLCGITQFNGAWWDEDNTITFGQETESLMRISANGGTPESIVQQKSRSINHPQILPDGKSVMYTAWPMPIVKTMVRSLKSGETKELFRGVYARYVPTRHILYVSPDDHNLYAAPFSLDRLEVTGGNVSVLEDVKQYAISDSGTLAYIPGTSDPLSFPRQTLVWVNREGKEEPISAEPNIYSFFKISPDGKRVALIVGATPKGHIWIWDVVRQTMTHLTLDEGADNAFPLWTPDGKRIVYASSRENISFGDLYWRAANGSGEAEMLASSPDRGFWPQCWTNKDGKALVLVENTRLNTSIEIRSMEGDHATKLLLQEKSEPVLPQVSPDGRWIAYQSSESGKSEIYVRSFPDVTKAKWQVSTSGGNAPLWSPDGRELFYRSGDATIAVRVETVPTFKPLNPTVLFRGNYSKASWVDETYWDISPDGKRFLMMKEVEAEAPRKINIVLNWFEELKERVPVD